MGPEVGRQIATPLAVIEGELGDVLIAPESAQEEVVEYGVMEHNHARSRQCGGVDLSVQAVVADVIERRVVAYKLLVESSGVVGHSGTGT
jgi:hypothetical protein